jgi:CubicO group peptidase (beta-lactamase class C family)
MTTNNLPAGIEDIAGVSPGSGYGLGVGVLKSPAQSGNLGCEGQFGWGWAASTSVIIDPEEDMVSIFLTQYMPG